MLRILFQFLQLGNTNVLVNHLPVDVGRLNYPVPIELELAFRSWQWWPVCDEALRLTHHPVPSFAGSRTLPPLFP